MDKIKCDRTFCCVPQCNSLGTRNPDLSFHKFPPDTSKISVKSITGNKILVPRKIEWIRLLRIGKKVSSRAKVCSKHFLPGDYITPANLSQRPRLRPTAVPSCFLPVGSRNDVVSNPQQSAKRQARSEKLNSKEQVVSSCCAFGCTEQFEIGSNVGFFKFPTDESRRDLWIKAVKRWNCSPTFSSVLCGKHFQTGKPSRNPVHPDYVPNIFIVSESIEKLPSPSSTDQIEESQCEIQDSIEIEDPESSSSSADISEDSPSKHPDHPDDVAHLFALKKSVEKHKGHSSAAQIEESQCVIYDNIEIEDIPIVPEISSSLYISEALTARIKNKVLGIGTELEQEIAKAVAIKKEIDELIVPDAIDELTNPDAMDELIIPDAAETVFESSRPEQDEISILKLKLNQAYTNVYTLRKEKIDILKKLTISSAQQRFHENSVTEKELLKLKKELQQANKEISALRTEKAALQNYITDRTTDRILLDARKLNFFTGLNSIEEFNSLTNLLHDVDMTAASVPVPSKLLIVLMRLQLNLKYPDLADRFQTSNNTIWRICESVIPHLESKLKLLLEGLAPISADVLPKVSHCYKNTVFVKLYQTIQRYKSTTKECDNDEFTNIFTNKPIL